jgi:hypothetical protein
VSPSHVWSLCDSVERSRAPGSCRCKRVAVKKNVILLFESGVSQITSKTRKVWEFQANVRIFGYTRRNVGIWKKCSLFFWSWDSYVSGFVGIYIYTYIIHHYSTKI